MIAFYSLCVLGVLGSVFCFSKANAKYKNWRNRNFDRELCRQEEREKIDNEISELRTKLLGLLEKW